jgi:hypothetical protein
MNQGDDVFSTDIGVLKQVVDSRINCDESIEGAGLWVDIQLQQYFGFGHGARQSDEELWKKTSLAGSRGSAPCGCLELSWVGA